MKRLLFLALLVSGCTFDPNLGGDYWPCKTDGTCPNKCFCLEGQVCVPEEDLGPEYCAWCKDDQTVCREGKEVWCARLDSDPENCGGCGIACELSNAIAECTESTCVIKECLDCFQDCDQLDETGCESCTDTDPGNCGECGVSCDNPPQPVCEVDDLIIYLDTGDCIDGQCRYQSSPRPCAFGCENGACKDDPCRQVNCNLNQHCENGLCVCDEFYADCDTSNLNGCETYVNTAENCGGCGVKCGINSVCNSGACECEYGFGNCDSNWETGCETEVLLNDSHCGTCNHPCETELTCCDGACVDTNTDRGNCGRCNLYCAGMTECCLGTCTDIQMNAENCGSCGYACTAPADTCCFAHCVDVLVDAGHCGDCGNECATNIPCYLGECGAQGIHCGAVTCDFWEEQCCSGVSGMACYPSGDCATRIVECDDDSDCGDNLYCCLVDNTQYVTRCASSNCMSFVCSSALYCALNDPDNLHCCTSDFDGQLVNVCQAEFCQ